MSLIGQPKLTVVTYVIQPADMFQRHVHFSIIIISIASLMIWIHNESVAGLQDESLWYHVHKITALSRNSLSSTEDVCFVALSTVGINTVTA